ncbi:CVNH domain-containing protein [Phormidium tenue FACHB-886]|nr:CVNH domain-containing protein [Phormidium tenue FACHB-886]
MLRNLKTSATRIGVLSLALLAASFLKPDAALAGGFARTCVDIQVQSDSGGAYLQARCTNANGQEVPAQLRISDYIANYDGNLSWALGGGGFHQSCSPSMHPNDRPILNAICGNGRGGFSRTSINLDEKISNQNGVLAIDR